MLPPIAQETITILRPEMKVDHGSQIPDWSVPPRETVNVSGCSVQPAGGNEDRLHRDSIGALFTVFAPPGVAVGALDRVLVDSYPTPLRIATEGQAWSSGFVLDHVVFDLVAWEG
jgi:hypothetical protein